METLFTLSMFELFAGGGGRLLEVGPVTVRMLLFAACLCATLIVAAYRPATDGGVPLAITLVAAYLIVHISALLVGTLKNNDPVVMITEIQQSLYWLAAPFLAAVLHSRRMIHRAATLIRLTGALMAVGYIGAVVALAIGAVDYLTFYATLNPTGEFAFRTETFFVYKGFLYLGIATIFFLARPGRYSALLMTLVVVALAMTLTRGFVLSTSAAALMMLVAQRRWRPVGLSIAAIASVAFFLWIYLPTQDDSISANREDSNNQRIHDFEYVADNIKVSSILFGEGLGTAINERINVENTFLWALWRLGAAGFCFWTLPLLLSMSYFARIRRHHSDYSLACAYMFSTILVYIQTLSNPYLNNPIGLSFVLVSLFSLRTISRHSTSPAMRRRLVVSRARGHAGLAR